ncbi:MAG: prolipoprotein diacylglyceryl transferase [Desulfobacterota bacterium]|nr:prolipoprotein diacylglyceryl transferase [Thermodesulfobacteriota bacterium]MDW8002118.1 prolipoprotein diacylglyceryl transferase [Deltaproteobacteria bacterium]
MIKYPEIDPEIFRIGPIALRWYGLMYLIGFLTSYLLTLYQIKRRYSWLKREIVDDLYFYLILGLVVGARLGYVLIYNMDYYLENPIEIFMLWHGGMSFHGGLIGCIVFGYVFAKKTKIPFFSVADIIVVSSPIGIGLGRIGNFINGELYGRVTDLPWAMVFPYGGHLPRHPSQLYEAFLEGLVLFLILWFYRERKRYEGELFTLFLVLYGIFRIFCEFFREPDGFVFGVITKGQALSIIMIISGLVLMSILRRK